MIDVCICLCCLIVMIDVLECTLGLFTEVIQFLFCYQIRFWFFHFFINLNINLDLIFFHFIFLKYPDWFKVKLFRVYGLVKQGDIFILFMAFCLCGILLSNFCECNDSFYFPMVFLSPFFLEIKLFNIISVPNKPLL